MSKFCFSLINTFLKSIVRTVFTNYDHYSFWIFRAPNPKYRFNHSSKYNISVYRRMYFWPLGKKARHFLKLGGSLIYTYVCKVAYIFTYIRIYVYE